MDYFVSTSFSKLEEIISAEKNATIRQKPLVLWHKKTGKNRKEIK